MMAEKKEGENIREQVPEEKQNKTLLLYQLESE